MTEKNTPNANATGDTTDGQAANGNRRGFLKAVGTGAAVAGAGFIAGCGDKETQPAAGKAPAVVKPKIKWRMQTYAGAALAAHVIEPSIKAFNEIADGQMEIELYFADQLVPTGELFRAVQKGTLDAVQSDEDSMAAPVDVAKFGGYFPFATRYSLDVPALFESYGLNEIWREAYAEVKGVTWLGAGAWDPCNFVTKKAINSLADLKGQRIFTFPMAGKFLEKYGVVPVTLPFEDVQVALQTGELDGIAWSGITEDYTVGWADATEYFLTNNIAGAWIGSYVANSKSWDALPANLQALFKVCMDSSNYYRQHWYWAGEAKLRVEGTKLKLTSIPDEEWAQVEADAHAFWEEVAASSPRSKKVVEIIKQYNEVMAKAGKPYRYES
ncbi:MAG: C4-dicarboxylate ABC transporter [Gammaproteobacteria bacterium]|nr:MAG: C4-dicarboxylate ABC transporter [Gammaproteobacteria bacterium]